MSGTLSLYLLLLWYVTATSCFVFIIFGLVGMDLADAQATTDPSEVRALSSIFQQWKIEAKWNTTGDPCSGAALNSLYVDEDKDFNPLIKCNCSYEANSTCHITQLKVSALDVVGIIPEELWTLNFLSDLNLGHNYLTGPLSASIGNLTNLRALSLGHNALSGELPKELGKLADLKFLAIGTMNTSGSPLSGLGNLTKLEQIYMDSLGISGEIPRTFANLQNLVVFQVSDTELSGRIPNFVGNWSKLVALVLQGNSLEGPIPSALSNLTLLKVLRISDLVSNANANSSLGFIKDMKSRSLEVLVLRNNYISGSIPSTIGKHLHLKQVDLSFNNLIGQIPHSLFSLPSLSMLFLGNNKLDGILPENKSTSLVTLDLSYNNLAGEFPSWVHDVRLQLNLVANNIDNSNSSALPSGLSCLQRNFSCNHGPRIFYDIAIKCGGPEIKSSKGIVYEQENEALGSATYFVTGKGTWGVSNVGHPTKYNDPGYVGTIPQYIVSSTSPFTNTEDPELFKTARISASSLRYYGLGLENGNYTVNLLFAEQQIVDTPRKSLGRRVFDIYIQGILVQKDFDIRKEAGGESFKVVLKEYKAQVSENYLEIHLFWAGKGTCCIPAEGTYGPIISAISATADFKPAVHKKNRAGLIVGIVVAAGSLLILLLVFLHIFQTRIKPNTCDNEDLLGIDIGPLTFSFSELKTATNDFSPANKLGEGGFGPVYKGILNDGRAIAVKQLSAASQQGKQEFVTEIATISAVQHSNLVNLYGFCTEGVKRLLVYEYLENKSLDQALFGKRSLNLNWSTRFDICLGIAKGLTYLHEESRLRIVHRDVKASNILLDSNLIPKISDFGLAKLYDGKKTHISTRIAGTLGYLAPEYAMRGHLTQKTDVFAFGVVALEIVSGRPNSDKSLADKMVYLLEWAWILLESKREVELVDSRLSEFNEDEARRITKIGLLCTQTSPMLRPPMSRVVGMLLGDIDVMTVTSKPGYLTDLKFDDESSAVTSRTIDLSAKGTESSFYDSSASTSIMGELSTKVIYTTLGDAIDARLEKFEEGIE